jgi:hypothetical protein
LLTIWLSQVGVLEEQHAHLDQVAVVLVVIARAHPLLYLQLLQ